MPTPDALSLQGYHSLFALRLVATEDHLEDGNALLEALFRSLAGLDALYEVLDLADETVLGLEFVLLRLAAVRVEVEIVAPPVDLAVFADSMDLPVAVRPGIAPRRLEGADRTVLEADHGLRCVLGLQGGL